MSDAKQPETQTRDEAWARERFGDVGPAPDNEVRPDKYAKAQPRGLAHPK
jgi:hypothetical protein